MEVNVNRYAPLLLSRAGSFFSSLIISSLQAESERAQLDPEAPAKVFQAGRPISTSPPTECVQFAREAACRPGRPTCSHAGGSQRGHVGKESERAPTGAQLDTSSQSLLCNMSETNKL
jgi:hypothetical protein